jgi:hypothetical protein
MSQDWKKLQKLPQLLKNKQPQKLMEEETKPLTGKGFETMLAKPNRRNTPFETERIERYIETASYHKADKSWPSSSQ